MTDAIKSMLDSRKTIKNLQKKLSENNTTEVNTEPPSYISPEDAEAARRYKEEAEQGNAEAQYNLYLCYYHGWGVKKNREEAVKWLKKAATQCFPAAQKALGDWYISGTGAEANKHYEQAKDWYKEAVGNYKKLAETGDAKAQFDLGECLFAVSFHLPDYRYEATKWFEQAAQQDYPKAMKTLAEIYEKGIYTEIDRQKAEKWRIGLEEIAKQGDADAQYELGNCYYNGYGVEKDESVADKWFRKAADQSHAEALAWFEEEYVVEAVYDDDDADEIKGIRGKLHNLKERIKFRLYGRPTICEDPKPMPPDDEIIHVDDLPDGCIITIDINVDDEEAQKHIDKLLSLQANKL